MSEVHHSTVVYNCVKLTRLGGHSLNPSALRREASGSEFEDRLFYKASFKSAMATQRNSTLENKTKNVFESKTNK